MNNCVDWLINSSINYPNKIAIIEEDNSITYSELLSKVKSVYKEWNSMIKNGIIRFNACIADKFTINFAGLQISRTS